MTAGSIIVTVLIAGGALGLLWFAFRRWGRTTAPVIPDKVEPETAQEQTTIEPSSGALLDPEAEQLIGTARWGRPERCRYVPEEYDGKIACLICHREILPGQFFWETPLISRETGEEIDTSFQLCLACQPGDIAAVIHRDA